MAQPGGHDWVVRLDEPARQRKHNSSQEGCCRSDCSPSLLPCRMFGKCSPSRQSDYNHNLLGCRVFGKCSSRGTGNLAEGFSHEYFRKIKSQTFCDEGAKSRCLPIYIHVAASPAGEG